MPRVLIAVILGVAAASIAVGAASAAPPVGTPVAEVLELDCGELGVFDAVTLQNDAVPAFELDGGRVLVAKRLSSEFSGTITTHDGQSFPVSDSEEESGARGGGFADRLVECTFGGSSSETFTLDAGTAAFFGIPEVYVGSEVTVEGTFVGTALAFVVGPGR